MILTKNFRDSEKAKILSDKIKSSVKNDLEYNFMEVCGTHTMSIAKFGIRNLLPKNVNLISGPGCPVCVTSQSEIDAVFNLLDNNDIILCAFGDFLRVPGGNGQNLLDYRANGHDIRIVTSPLDCIEICEENDSEVVFVGIGFETTIPTIASLVKIAFEKNIENLSLMAFLKTMPKVLELILSDDDLKIDGFLCPGHVSAITGISIYEPIVTNNKAAVVAGFEPVDILYSIYKLILQVNRKEFQIENLYSRTVKNNGNPLALQIMYEVFEEADVEWRGLGLIEKSGLTFKKEFQIFDAFKKFNIELKYVSFDNGCICGEILKGKVSPGKCDLFGSACSPEQPVGPCMVSSEGACAAYYKYGVQN